MKTFHFYTRALLRTASVPLVLSVLGLGSGLPAFAQANAPAGEASLSPVTGAGSPSRAHSSAGEQGPLAQAPDPEPEHAAGRVLVGAASGEESRAEQAIRGNNGRVMTFNEAGNFFVVETPSRAPEWAGSMRGKPGIRFAELDYKVRADATPNDPRWADMWGLKKIGMPTAWDITTGSPGVVVGVVDTGIDYNHEDLKSQMWSNPQETQNGVDDDGNGFVDDVYGADCANGDGDPFDDNNHGTHVAGTIGAATDNYRGVPGINWNVKLMALKFLDSSGAGYISAAVKCLDYAVSKGAYMTNNSWGGGGYSQALADAIGRGRSANQLFIAAAGNNNVDTDLAPFYPAGYALDNVISVGATDSVDAKATFSNFGKASVDLAAPGVGIVSTVSNNGYATFSGTSMATPHVAGTAALMMAKAGTRAPFKTVLDAVYASVDPVPSLQGLVATGGRLNAARALQASLSTTAHTAYPAATAVQESSTVRSGGAASLKADDNAYYAVNSTTAGTRITSWYGTLQSIPSTASNVKVIYKGKNSRSCTQTVSVWRFSDSTWVQLDSRSVSTTEKLVTLNVAGASSYVDSAGGEMRLRVRCSGTRYNFYSSADLMKVSYDAP